MLILGGTGEARTLAQRLADDGRLHVITSLAGRTRDPVMPSGEVRTGGFGGVAGLAAYLSAERIDLLVDATHPYADRMAANAAQACAEAGVPRVKLLRPAWEPVAGDVWLNEDSASGAAGRLAELPHRRVFLATGAKEIAVYRDLTEHRFLVRLIEAPAGPLPLANHDLVLARGPFDEEAEAALLSDHGIEVLVSKNSGGPATYAKIAAARRLSLPVVMIERPPPPPGETVESVEAALAWIEECIA